MQSLLDKWQNARPRRILIERQVKDLNDIMAIELAYDKKLQTIMARVHGRLKVEDIEKSMHMVLTSSDIPSDANTLWDITEMEFESVDLELQQQIVEMRKKFDIQRGKAKIALVSNYPLGEVIVKLFLVLMEEISQDVKAFETREQAIHWFQQV